MPRRCNIIDYNKVMYLNLNENQIQQSWANHIKESLGVTDNTKLNWMSKYAYFHSMNEKMLNESVDGHAHLNPNMTIGGMGNIAFPSAQTRAAYEPGLAGSGDKTFSTLPLGLQIAAQTIALDLLYVVPMSTPHGTQQYLDYVYEGGRIHPSDPFATSNYTGKNTASPYMIKVNAKFAIEGEGEMKYRFIPNRKYAFFAGDTQIKDYELTFLYPDRVDGYPLFRVMEKAYHSENPVLGGEGAEKSIYELVNGLYKGGETPDYTLEEIGQSSPVLFECIGFANGLEPVENVKALQNHIASYSGRGFLGENPATDYRAYSRGLGEETPARQLGLKSFDIDYKADTIKVSAAITREQVQDLKVYGIDAVSQVEAKLADELTQTINKQILQKMFTLGAINAKQVEEVESPVAGVSKLSAYFTNGTPSSDTAQIWLGFDRDGEPITVGAKAVNITAGGEVMGTIQRRILSKILYASQVIHVRGRLGQGNFAVVSGTIGASLQDIAGFMPYPMSNTLGVNKSLYPIGSLSGISIYVDPNMKLDDMRILVGRKGKEGEPGLMFAPYLLAEKVETTSEFTFGPVMVMSSRYSIVEVGHNPQLQYVTLGIKLEGVDII